MPSGGKIAVTGEVQSEQLVIHVTDDGIGISPEDVAKIMEPLYTTKARGMGLGLAISIAILQKNGGTLAVSSQVGIGSTFTVTLPIT